MGEISQIIGAKIPFIADGKTYYLSYLTDEIRAEFERQLELHALETVYKQKEALEREDWLELLARVNEDIASGKYSFGGKSWQLHIQSPSGLFTLLYLLMKTNQPKMSFKEAFDLGLKYNKEIAAACKEAMSQPVPKNE